MSLKYKILQIVRRQRPLVDIVFYFEGNLRYYLYYSKYKWLIRKHIIEQIKYRIRVMRPICYEQGSCIKCGCETLNLQMCTKSCDGLCYPRLVSRKIWDKKGNIKDKKMLWIWVNYKKEYILLYENLHTYVLANRYNTRDSEGGSTDHYRI